MKILVLGYFGHVTNQLDGQTVRTRSIHALLESERKEQIDYFDTQTFKQSKLNLVKMFVALMKVDIVFYIAAHNNLKYLFPFIYLVAKLFGTKIKYVAIGGWLFDFLKNKPIHRYMLSGIEDILVQTDNLYVDLQTYQFKNVHTLNNFRMIQYPTLNIENNYKETVNLVFMARVHPLKGVDLLFKLDEALKKSDIHNASIDIYGPILSSYKDEFFFKLESSSIRYCGILEPANIYTVLQQYDLMLFPTKYYTEGFPGTILDAYISGLPVIATNWLNAEEFIDNGETGYIVDFDNDNDFIERVINILKRPQELLKLKECVLIKRNKYSSDEAWKVLKRAIYNDLNV